MLHNIILKKVGIIFLIVCMFGVSNQLSTILFSHSANVAYAAPGGTDTDNDGVDDVDDLDDDNDGILDVHEVTLIDGDILNTPNYPKDTALQSSSQPTGNWSKAVLNNLYGNTVDFTASIINNGTGMTPGWWWLWVQIRSDATVGDNILLQPTRVWEFPADAGKYVFDFKVPVVGLSVEASGLNFNDILSFSWSYKWIPVDIDGTNFSNFDPGMSYVAPNSLIWSWTSGWISVNSNRATFTLNEPIDQLVILWWKSGGSSVNGTATIGLSTITYYQLTDTDGDGIPNSKDLDSDNDGISDLQESWFASAWLDANNDGTIDLSEATSFSGWLATDFGSWGTIPVDSFNTSGDNTPDYLDLDSDDDGIPDATEARASNQYLSYSATGATLDSDNDGILDMYDSDGTTTVWSGAIFGSTKTEFKTSARTPENTDGADTADYLDLNSDNDEFLDSDSRESGTISWVSYSDPDWDVDNPLTSGTLDNNDADSTDTDFRSLDTSDISWYAWNDTNMNGVQNGWESAYSWATIKLLSSTWAVLRTTSTDASGNYSFTGVVVWEYGLEISTPVGFGLSPTWGGTSTTDSDFDRNTNKVSNITLWESNIDNLDAWLFALQNMSLGWRVWDDMNNDTNYDSSLESWLESVVVEIYRDANQNNQYDAGDTLLATGSTDTSGNYLFTNIRAGDYLIVLPASNFATGATFEGYNSSDDTIAPQDPDNDTSDQDNGQNIGDIVSSLAITLLQGTENGWDANTTLDLWLYKIPEVKTTWSAGGSSSSSKTSPVTTTVVPEPSENKVNTEELVVEKQENIIPVVSPEEISEKLKKFETPLLVEREIIEEKTEVKSINILPKQLPRTGTAISKRVNTLTQSKVETNLPSSDTFRLAGSQNSNIEYWKQVLVEQDRNAAKYIVVPSNGLVVPIGEFAQDSDNFNEMIHGREWDINPALEGWALEYPWADGNGYWEQWNKVIFGHSSYWKDAPGRYKTHFQKIIELDAGEQIWIYEKNSTGKYDRYKYVTQKSYNTSADDVEVLLPWEGKNLTLFTCTPIGWIAGRWIIKAKYIEDNNWNNDSNKTVIEQKDYFYKLSPKYKKAIDKYMWKLLVLSDKKTRANTLYQHVEKLLEKYKSNQQLTLVLEYLQYRLIKDIISE